MEGDQLIVVSFYYIIYKNLAYIGLGIKAFRIY